MESRMISILLLISISSVVIGKSPKPIYAVKDDVENVKGIDKAVNEGANGLYSIFKFDSDGTPKSVGGMISGDSVDVYFDGLRKKIDPQSKNYNETLVLQIFETDVSGLDHEKKKGAAIKLRDLMLKHQLLKKDTANFAIVFLITQPGDANFINLFLELPDGGDGYQKHRIGAGIKNGSPEENKDTLKKIVPNGFIWQANLVSRVNPNLPHTEYEKALKLKEKGEISKVVGGIVSRDATMQTLLTYNMDAIVTPDPGGLVKIVGDAKNKDKYRMAKRSDDPTKTF